MVNTHIFSLTEAQYTVQYFLHRCTYCTNFQSTYVCNFQVSTVNALSTKLSRVAMLIRKQDEIDSLSASDYW